MHIDDFPVSVGEPFSFEWPVDTHGYELRELSDDAGAARRVLASGIQIVRRGGPLRWYRPLEDRPGLFLEFAELEATPENAVAFSNEYGLLGWRGERSDHEGMSFDDWKKIHEKFKDLAPKVKDAIIDYSASDLAWLVNERMAPRCFTYIDYWSGTKPQKKVRPVTLAAALGLQLQDQVTNGVRYRQCKTCPTWFPFGPGTQNRSSKEFCSDRCRVAWNRQQKQEARS